MSVVKVGDFVTIEFHVHSRNGRFESDSFVESFVVGQGQVMSALETAVTGATVGELVKYPASPRELNFAHPVFRGLPMNQPVRVDLTLLDLQPGIMGASTDCVFITEQEVAALFERWNDSLQTRDPEQVAKNYSKSAVLLPTVSDVPRQGHEAIEDYFHHFLAKAPAGKIDDRFIKIGCNSVQDVGLYTFKFDDGREVQARYSFVYEYEDGRWVISHHHSSMMPEQFVGH